MVKIIFCLFVIIELLFGYVKDNTISVSGNVMEDILMVFEDYLLHVPESDIKNIRYYDFKYSISGMTMNICIFVNNEAVYNDFQKLYFGGGADYIINGKRIISRVFYK